MQKGPILFLSGLTSTGKTSIAREALNSRAALCACLSYDLFEETLPVWAADDDARYAQAILALYAAARSFSDQGLPVLIDGLVMNLPGLCPHGAALRRAFAGYPLHMVHVVCPMDELRRRNAVRGDRRIDQSQEQEKRVDPGVRYDLTLDTSRLTPAQCADALMEYLRRVCAART